MIVYLSDSVLGEGARLEYVAGTFYWETMPGARHRDTVMAIWSRPSTERKDSKGCGYFPYAELTLGFFDDSVKTPGLSLFCLRPEEREEFVDFVLEAVVEVPADRPVVSARVIEKSINAALATAQAVVQVDPFDGASVT